MSQLCSVEGIVVRATGEPLGKAEVTIERHERMSHITYAAHTQRDGRFRIADIEPGQYRLDVVRNGFVKEPAGEEWFGGVLLLMFEPERSVEGIVVRMLPQGAISGRVTDEDGEAAANVPMTLWRQQSTEGGINWVPVYGQVRTTNDLGDYRIPGLLPGTYRLGANLDQLWPRHGMHGIRYEPAGASVRASAYYPGATDIEQAQSIEIAEGQELSGYNLRLDTLRAFRVRGRVELPEGADPQSLSLMLGPQRIGGHGWIGGGGGDRARSLRPDAFEIGGVRAGAHLLVANCSAGGRNRNVQLPIEVIDRDIEDLVVRFPTGPTLQGIVRAAGEGALDPTAVHIWLRPENPSGQFASATADTSGKFTLFDVAAGVYEAGVHIMPPCGYLHSVKYDGREAPGEQLEIHPEAADGMLEILIGLDGGEVRGVLKDSNGKALQSRNVHLLTDPPRFDRAIFARTDQDGRVWFRHLRPGNYWLFAVDGRPGVPLADRWESQEGVVQKVKVVPNGVEEFVLRLPV